MTTSWTCPDAASKETLRYCNAPHCERNGCELLACANAYALGRAAGREEAAQECVKWGDAHVAKWQHSDEMSDHSKAAAWIALQCAAAIRALEP